MYSMMKNENLIVKVMLKELRADLEANVNWRRFFNYENNVVRMRVVGLVYEFGNKKYIKDRI